VLCSEPEAEVRSAALPALGVEGGGHEVAREVRGVWLGAGRGADRGGPAGAGDRVRARGAGSQTGGLQIVDPRARDDPGAVRGDPKVDGPRAGDREEDDAQKVSGVLAVVGGSHVPRRSPCAPALTRGSHHRPPAQA